MTGRSATVEVALEVALFQAAWWLAVGGAASGNYWIGPLAIALYLAIHLLRCDPAWRARRAATAAALAGAGFAIDSLQSALGLLQFDGAAALGLAPLWIVALWAQLAGAVPALVLLAHRPFVAALLGAIGGPLAFAGGGSLGAVAFPVNPLPSLFALALIWGTVVPQLARLAPAAASEPDYRFDLVDVDAQVTAP